MRVTTRVSPVTAAVPRPSMTIPRARDREGARPLTPSAGCSSLLIVDVDSSMGMWNVSADRRNVCQIDLHGDGASDQFNRHYYSETPLFPEQDSFCAGQSTAQNADSPSTTQVGMWLDSQVARESVT